jgi:hypothetical protein
VNAEATRRFSFVAVAFLQCLRNPDFFPILRPNRVRAASLRFPSRGSVISTIDYELSAKPRCCQGCVQENDGRKGAAFGWVLDMSLQKRRTASNLKHLPREGDSACECYEVIRQYDGELGLK